MNGVEAREIVRATLVELGLNVSDARGVTEAQADFAFLRRQRRASERVSLVVKAAAVTTFIGGLMTVLWLGVKAALLP